jgi:hypothetical protein
VEIIDQEDVGEAVQILQAWGVIRVDQHFTESQRADSLNRGIGFIGKRRMNDSDG